MKYDYFKSNKLKKDRLIIVSENKYTNEIINTILLTFLVGFLLYFISDISSYYLFGIVGTLFVFVGAIRVFKFENVIRCR